MARETIARDVTLNGRWMQDGRTLFLQVYCVGSWRSMPVMGIRAPRELKPVEFARVQRVISLNTGGDYNLTAIDMDLRDRR